MLYLEILKLFMFIRITWSENISCAYNFVIIIIYF